MNVSTTTTPGNSAFRSLRKLTSASLASCFTVTGVPGVALVLLDLLGDVPERDAQDLRQPLQLAVGPVVGEVRRADADRGRARVVDDHPAAPVANRPSRGLDPLRAELVVLGGLEMLRPGQDLQRPQAEEEDGEGDEHEEAEDPDPEDHLRREAIRRLGARVRRQEAAGAKAGAGASQRTPPADVAAAGTKSRRHRAKTGNARIRFSATSGGSASTSATFADTGSPSMKWRISEPIA